MLLLTRNTPDPLFHSRLVLVEGTEFGCDTRGTMLMKRTALMERWAKFCAEAHARYQLSSTCLRGRQRKKVRCGSDALMTGGRTLLRWLIGNCNK
jgi:hypothetical protein